MTNATEVQSYRMGPLSKNKFIDYQEFADEIAAKLIGTAETGIGGAPGNVGAPGETGPPGTPGSKVELKESTMAVTNGATSIELSENVESAIVNLLNNSDAGPAVGISAINGARVHFTAAIPTGNYKVRWIKIVIT